MSLRTMFRQRPAPASTGQSGPAGSGEAAEPSPAELTTPQQVIAEAERLEAEGRPFEAIDLLTERNRVERDVRYERRLVNLRHRAFDAVDRTKGRPEWPPVYEDLFPDVVGRPPEVDVSELTADAIGSGITNHGCLLVRGLISPERCSQIIDGIDRAFVAYDAWDQGAPATETQPWFVPFSPLPKYKLGKGRPWVRAGGGVYTIDSPRVMFDVLEAFGEAGVVESIAGYMGERPAVSVKKSTLRRVPVDTGTDWHQDGEFIGAGVRSTNVWVSLTPCGVDAPGLDIVPRRIDHLVDSGVEGAQFEWSVGQPVVDREAADTPVMRPVFEAGDALLFDDLFLHRTGVAPGMDTERYAIESWFFAPSTYPVGQVPIAY